MMSDIYYGELSDERLNEWDCENNDPYQVLKWKKQIRVGGWDFLLDIAKKYFIDEIQIDWGSFAWKGNKEAILLMMENEKNITVEDYEQLEDGITYGIVFIEQVSDLEYKGK